MATELVELGNGMVSLEFDPGDAPDVKAAIRRLYGDWTSEKQGVDTTLRFGGEQFVLMQEWDEAAILPLSMAGAEMLRGLKPELADKVLFQSTMMLTRGAVGEVQAEFQSPDDKSMKSAG